jgi:cytidine deaminase
MADVDALRAAAEAARQMNWTPYSHFVVLAAVETVDGRVYGGSNVENVNFTLTKHAEENAVVAALADGALVRSGRQWLRTIDVQSSTDSGPCGGCRQFVNEFAADDAVWIKHDTAAGTIVSRPFRDLLPFDFGPRHLGL